MPGTSIISLRTTSLFPALVAREDCELPKWLTGLLGRLKRATCPEDKLGSMPTRMSTAEGLAMMELTAWFRFSPTVA